MDQKNEEIKMISAEAKLMNTIYKVEQIFESNLSWETKYGRIFAMNKQIQALICKIGLSMDYYDPDTTYEILDYRHEI